MERSATTITTGAATSTTLALLSAVAPATRGRCSISLTVARIRSGLSPATIAIALVTQLLLMTAKSTGAGRATGMSTSSVRSIILGLCALNVTFSSTDELLGFGASGVCGLLGVKDDEAKLTTPVANLIKGQLDAVNLAEARKVLFQLIFRHIRVDATNKYLLRVGLRLCLSRVDHFVLDGVGTAIQHSFNGLFATKCDEAKASRVAGGGVVLNVDILNWSKLTEVLDQVIFNGERYNVTNLLSA